MDYSRNDAPLSDADVFHYLGNPTRLKILEHILEGEKSVGQLQQIVGKVKQGRLSSHLA